MYKHRIGHGMNGVHDAMQRRKGQQGMARAHQGVVEGTARYAEMYPDNPEVAVEYVRHAASVLRAMDLERRDLERDKTDGLLAALRGV